MNKHEARKKAISNFSCFLNEKTNLFQNTMLVLNDAKIPLLKFNSRRQFNDLSVSNVLDLIGKCLSYL